MILQQVTIPEVLSTMLVVIFITAFCYAYLLIFNQAKEGKKVTINIINWLLLFFTIILITGFTYVFLSISCGTRHIMYSIITAIVYITFYVGSQRMLKNMKRC